MVKQIRAKLTADTAQFDRKMRGSKKAVESTSGSMHTLASAARAVGVAFLGIKALSEGKDVALLAARYETLGVAMHTVGRTAGYSAGQMDAFQAGLARTGIAMVESRVSLMRLIQAHVKLSTAQKLARIAQDAAVIGAMNSSQAFEQMVYGIQSANVRVLRTIGINVNFQQSYMRLSRQLHISVLDLTQTQKAQARLNAVLAAGPTIAGAYTSAMTTAGKKLLSLKRYSDNLKVSLGEAFTPALGMIVDQLTAGIKDLTSELQGNKDGVRDWAIFFVHSIASVEAEFLRFGMLLDKIGGTMTTVGMLLTAPGKQLGIESSIKRFDAYAQANIDLENRYNSSMQRLQDLANNELKIVNQITNAYAKKGKALDEQNIKLRESFETGKIYTTGLEKQAAVVDVLTQHILQSGKNKIASWKAQQKAIKATDKALKTLEDTGKNYDIPIPEWMAGTDALTQNIIDQSDMAKTVTDSTTQYIEDRWKQAYDGIQSSLADWIYNWKISFDSIADMFKHMLAEMVAAWLMNKAKMAIGNWLSDTGGWVGEFGNFLSSSSSSGGGGSGLGSTLGSSAAGAALKGWVAKNTSAGFQDGISTASNTIGLAGGAYGMYSGVQNMRRGNTATGAVQTGLGAYTTYNSAVDLGLIQSGTATSLMGGGTTVAPYVAGGGQALGSTAGATVVANSGSTVVVGGGMAPGEAGIYTAGSVGAAQTGEVAATGATGSVGGASGGAGGGAGAGASALGIVAIMAVAAYLLANSSTSTQYRKFTTSDQQEWTPVRHEAGQGAYFDAQQGLIDEAARGAKFGFDDMTKSITDFQNGVDVLTNQFHDGFAQMYLDVQKGNTSFATLAETMAKAGGVAVSVGHDQEQMMKDLATQAAGGSRDAFLSLIATMQSLGITTQNAQTAALAMISAMSGMTSSLPAATSNLNSLTSAVSTIGNAPSPQAYDYSQWPINALASGSAVRAHAAGGIFAAPVHLFGEAGPEAVVPLHSGPDTLKKMDAKLDALAGRPITINLESTTTLDGEVLGRHTERITHRVIEDRDRSGVSRVLWAAA